MNVAEFYLYLQSLLSLKVLREVGVDAYLLF